MELASMTMRLIIPTKELIELIGCPFLRWFLVEKYTLPNSPVTVVSEPRSKKALLRDIIVVTLYYFSVIVFILLGR